MEGRLNTPGNARSAASKAAICGALLDLLQEKELGRVTVQEIVQKAGVNRSTFYAHYLDTHDLMEKMEREMVAPLTAEMFSDEATTDTIFNAEALRRMISYFRENRVFYRIFFAESADNHIMQESAHLMLSRFIQPRLEQSSTFAPAEYGFQFEFCKAGFLGVICRWLDGGCAETDEVVAGVLEKLIWRCLK